MPNGGNPLVADRREHLQEIEECISRDSIAHAIHFVDRLIESAEKLTYSPNLGRVVPEFQREGIREILLRNYRVVYQVKGNCATILRIVHGARDLTALMSKEPWMLD